MEIRWTYEPDNSTRHHILDVLQQIAHHPLEPARQPQQLTSHPRGPPSNTSTMASEQADIYDSMTMQSDSETYEQEPEVSSPSSDSSSPLILYSPPTFWGLARGAAINLLLPFVNGLMLGFGELFANELAFRFGWSNTKVRGLGRDPREALLTSLDLSHAQTSRAWCRDANGPHREEETQRPRDGCLHELGMKNIGRQRVLHTATRMGFRIKAWKGVGVLDHGFFLLSLYLSLCEVILHRSHVDMSPSIIRLVSAASAFSVGIDSKEPLMSPEYTPASLYLRNRSRSAWLTWLSTNPVLR